MSSINVTSLENTGVFITSVTETLTVVSQEEVVTTVNVGFQGPSGAAASVSNDPGNSVIVGTDGGIYVSDNSAIDPVAYYILAKA